MFTQTSPTPHSRGRKSTGCPLEPETPSTNSAGEQATPPRWKRETTCPQTFPARAWRHLWPCSFTCAGTQTTFPSLISQNLNVFHVHDFFCLFQTLTPWFVWSWKSRKLNLKIIPTKVLVSGWQWKFKDKTNQRKNLEMIFLSRENLGAKQPIQKTWGWFFFIYALNQPFFGVQTIFRDNFHSTLLSENTPTPRSKQGKMYVSISPPSFWLVLGFFFKLSQLNSYQISSKAPEDSICLIFQLILPSSWQEKGLEPFLKALPVGSPAAPWLNDASGVTGSR